MSIIILRSGLIPINVFTQMPPLIVNPIRYFKYRLETNAICFNFFTEPPSDGCVSLLGCNSFEQEVLTLWHNLEDGEMTVNSSPQLGKQIFLP